MYPPQGIYCPFAAHQFLAAAQESHIVQENHSIHLEGPLNDKYEILLGLKSRDIEKVIYHILEHYHDSARLTDSYLPARAIVPEYLITPFNPSFVNTPISIPAYSLG